MLFVVVHEVEVVCVISSPVRLTVDGGESLNGLDQILGVLLVIRRGKNLGRQQLDFFPVDELELVSLGEEHGRLCFVAGKYQPEAG